MLRFARGMLVLAMMALPLASACRDASAPVQDTTRIEPGLDTTAAAVATEPVDGATGALLLSGAAAGSAAAAADGSAMTFVSLQPGRVPGGSIAEVRNRRTGSMLSVLMEDGGFDPVPIVAAPGDLIDINVSVAGGATTIITKSVPLSRAPRVVRTIPVRGKRDHPLNQVVVVVFTEPVTAQSASAGVRLLRGGDSPGPVPGTARLVIGVRTTVVFEPSQGFAPNTEYTLEVTGGIRDLSGDRLSATTSVEFTTGTEYLTSIGNVRVVPSVAALASGTQLQLLVEVQDSLGRRLQGRPVFWSTDNVAVARVSETGLVTGGTPGRARIRASSGNVSGESEIVVSATLPRVASVAVQPALDTVPLGALLRFTAIARDTAGNVQLNRPTDWQATGGLSLANPSQSTVASVRGTAIGTGSVTATVQERQGSATAIVEDAGLPYAGVSSGWGASCGVTWRGWVLCWGNNAYGALGNGTTDYISQTRVTRPGPAAGGVRFASVATGEYHTCALTAEGQAWCWGLGSLGALGSGPIAGLESCPPDFRVPCSTWPVRVAGEHRFSSIDVGAFSPGQGLSCAIDVDEAAWCWGGNVVGQLGTGSATGPEDCGSQPCATTPHRVSGGLRFRTIAVGPSYACGLTTDGRVYCWGHNDVGTLGDGTVIARNAPVPIASARTFTGLSAGGRHACAIASDGTGHCWGFNHAWQLGAEVGDTSTVPVEVSGGHRWARLEPGAFHTCGITTTGTAYCWGETQRGLGSEGFTNWRVSTPTAVAGGLTFSDIAPGSAHTCGRTAGGELWCWSSYGDLLGVGPGHPGSRVPVKVGGQP